MAVTETNKRAARGWICFDIAMQPAFTVLVTFVFAPYFAGVVAPDSATGQSWIGYATAVAAISIAILSPMLGAIADGAGRRKPWIAAFGVVYLFATMALWFAVPGANPVLILAAFALVIFSAEIATAFNNAMLPDFAAPQDVGRISGNGWALGYVGGIVSLLFVLTMLAEGDAGRTLIGRMPLFGLDPETREGTRAAGPFAALWFIVFILPFFLLVPDRPDHGIPRRGVSESLSDLVASLKSLPGEIALRNYLLSSMFYRDAMAGLFTFGGIYAQGVLGLSVVDVGVFGLASLVGGVFGASYGGVLDSRLGPLVVIRGAIIILIVACIAVVLTTAESILLIPVAEGSSLPKIAFYIYGAVIGGAVGPLQAASRTVIVRLTPPERMTEVFGLYALAGKASAFLAPLSIAILTDLTGSQQIGITPIIVLFLIGLVLLRFVKVPRPEMGQDAA